MEPIQSRGTVTPPAAAKPAAAKQPNRVAALANNLAPVLSAGPKNRTGFKPAAREAESGDTVRRFAHADRKTHETFINFQEQLDVRIHGARTLRTVEQAIAESLQDPAAQEALAKEKADLEALAQHLDEEESLAKGSQTFDDDHELAKRLEAEERSNLSKLPIIEEDPAHHLEEEVNSEDSDALALSEAMRLSLEVEVRPRPAAAEPHIVARTHSQEEAELALAIAESLAENKMTKPTAPKEDDGFVLMNEGKLPEAEMQKLAEQNLEAFKSKENQGQDGNCTIS